MGVLESTAEVSIIDTRNNYTMDGKSIIHKCPATCLPIEHLSWVAKPQRGDLLSTTGYTHLWRSTSEDGIEPVEEIPVVPDARKILNHGIPLKEGRSIDGERVRSRRNRTIAAKKKTSEKYQWQRLETHTQDCMLH